MNFIIFTGPVFSPIAFQLLSMQSRQIPIPLSLSITEFDLISKISKWHLYKQSENLCIYVVPV